MSGILTKFRGLPSQFPLIRGMVSYAVIWPTCSVVQEYIEHGTPIHEADWSRAARFGVFGTFFMAPVFYTWMKYSGRFFKAKTLTTAVARAVLEQVSYSPLVMAYFFFGMNLLEMKPIDVCINEVREKFWPTYKIGPCHNVSYSPLAMAYFFFGMSLLEMKPIDVCINEVREKFWPTYKIGVIFWPTAQTLNFYFVSEKNRIVFVSAASFVWTVYLAHMKSKEQELLLEIPEQLSDTEEVTKKPK